MLFLKMRSVGFCAVLLSSAVFRDAPALASIDYGNFNGTNVNYLQVTESSTTNSNALYGAPTVTANAIEFGPNSFAATSSGGAAPQTTQGDLTTTLSADPNIQIQALQFAEEGDYTLEGTGTSATAVSVTAPVTITILQVNGVPITPIVSNTNLVFSPSSSYSLPTNEGAGVSYTGGAMVNLSTLVFDAGYTGQATEVSWDLDNTLTASSEAGTVALIAKKAVSGSVMVEPVLFVPEPASLALFALALPLLAARRGRTA
jgi:hypothetical protein